MILPDRFWAKVREDGATGCWIWTAAKSEAGYGRYLVERSCKYAHRLAYESMVGPIPDGLQLDHLCRVPSCVNPAHLEPVTPAVNMRRGIRAQQTHCKNGHPLSGENLRMHTDSRGYQRRYCVTCNIARSAAWREARMTPLERHRATVEKLIARRKARAAQEVAA